MARRKVGSSGPEADEVRSAPRIAIVHDWMVSPGGAERTVLAMHQIWPDAPIYVSAYNPDKFPEFASADIRTTWLNRIPLAQRKQQLFTIPRALAFKTLDLSDYDIVISSCSAESKYVRTGKAIHICYCHTPIRYYWSDYDWYRTHPPFGSLNWLAKLLLPILIPFLRRMDYRAAQRVTAYVANSDNVRHRIRQYYDRDATVIYPPVVTSRFDQPRSPRDYYLIVGRQVAYKRLDLVVDAFNQLGLPLVVSGDGEEVKVQQARAKFNISFVGRASDRRVAELFAGARGFVFPPEEDFGMIPVEAMAAGCPVIAYGRGGALESVVEGQTGTFFAEQTPESLVEAVRRFEKMTFDESTVRARAKEFDEGVFKTQLKALVDDAWQKRIAR